MDNAFEARLRAIIREEIDEDRALRASDSDATYHRERAGLSRWRGDMEARRAELGQVHRPAVKLANR